LIRAAILPPDGAARAWEEWLALESPMEIDTEVARLIPLLVWNLEKAGVGGDTIRRLAKGARRSRFIASTITAAALDITRALERHSIQPLLLKGFPLAHLCYPSPELRPMSDVDVLVDRDVAPGACAALEAEGWRSRAPLTPESMKVSHGAELVRNAARCDLHWSLMWEGDTGLDREILDRAMTVSVEGQEFRVPDQGDLLLHVIVHGTRIGEGRLLRWVPDAHFVVMRGEPHVDWERFVEMVVRHRLAWPVRDALVYLREIAETRVPDGVLEAIPSQTTTSIQRRVHVVDLGDAATADAMTYLPTLLSRYRRLARGGPLSRLRWIASAFEQAWGVPGWRLPWEVLRRLSRKVGRVFLGR